jgi:hypothetical protein
MKFRRRNSGSSATAFSPSVKDFELCKTTG